MNFRRKIYNITQQIPYGRVVSYGQLALLAGNPRAARAVGYAMRQAPHGLPCHRVVHQDGSTTDAFDIGSRNFQRQMLEAEGVEFTPEGRVKMEDYRWDGEGCQVVQE